MQSRNQQNLLEVYLGEELQLRSGHCLKIACCDAKKSKSILLYRILWTEQFLQTKKYL